MKLYGIICLGLLVCFVTCTKESTKHGSKHYDADGEHDDDYDHEAILGSEDEAEEFSHLSPEEAKERLGKLFVKMDANQDGSLDNQELVQWILNSFSKMNLEDTKQKVKVDDKDEDGMVTWEEFMVSTYGMPEDELETYKQNDLDDEEAKKTMEKSIAYDKQKFAAADENGDKKLDMAEASAFLHPYDYPRMSEVESSRILADYDTNGDGKVSAEEYISNPSFAKKSAEDLIGEKENFLHHDKDGDKELNKEEIMKWVSPDLAAVAGEEAAHLMEETDKNKDGQLTVEEVKEEHELWVGSEITDYGDLLEHDEL